MKQLLLITVFFISLAAIGQNTATLKGKILNLKSEELAGVTVKLQNTNFATSTDNEGNFQFVKLPAGKYTIVATNVGFIAKGKEVQLAAGKDLYLQLALEENQTALSEVTVVGNKQKGYNASSSSVATRLNLPLLETPQSIQVIPYQIIRDQQALTVNDAMKNVAGVQNIAPGYSYYTFRGFDSYNNGPGVITNGIRGVNYSFFQTASLFNIDKIEAIKGPASALYSIGNPGGIINMATKKPLSTNQYEFNTTVDNFGDYRFIADATGPLDKNKKVLYRLIAGYNGGKTFRDNIKTNYFFIAPSFTFNFSDKTNLNIEWNQVIDNTNIRGDRGIVAQPKANGTIDFDAVPLSWNRTSQNDKGKITSTLLQAFFRHKFSDKFSFTALHSYGVSKNDNESYSYDFGGNFNATNDSLTNGSWVKGPFGTKSFNLNYFFNYAAKTGSIKHDLIFGADYGSSSSYDRSIAYAAPDLAIANPVNTGNPATYPLSYSLDINNNINIYGLYVQDVISFSKKVKALVGLRYDGSVGKDNTTFDINTSPYFTFKGTFNSLLPLSLIHI
jgi:iron complex outermembrane receptor protein